MTSTIARRTALALASVAVTVTAVLASGGVASAATATSGGSSGSTADSDHSGVSRQLAEICRQVDRNGGVAIVRLTDRHGQVDEARSRWIADQITWICSHF
ncbi:hypothetical protein ACFC09_29915 [Streptomyces sp. NPDC056161]|uniref:hypothetical protein n=1 Tax=unclassified Streptomyces TaxID=2593676 RepID=UPI0035D68BF8